MSIKVVVANLEYKDHIVSVSAIWDTQHQYQFTPFVEIRARVASSKLLNTILTHHQAFTTDQKAIEFGFGLGREWIDNQSSKSPE